MVCGCVTVWSSSVPESHRCSVSELSGNRFVSPQKKKQVTTEAQRHRVKFSGSLCASVPLWFNLFASARPQPSPWGKIFQFFPFFSCIAVWELLGSSKACEFTPISNAMCDPVAQGAHHGYHAATQLFLLCGAMDGSFHSGL